MKCERCGKKTNIHTLSRFNTQQICPECEAREKKHPLYEVARKKEHEAVMRGDMNFPGIGLPDDLKYGGKS